MLLVSAALLSGAVLTHVHGSSAVGLYDAECPSYELARQTSGVPLSSPDVASLVPPAAPLASRPPVPACAPRPAPRCSRPPPPCAPRLLLVFPPFVSSCLGFVVLLSSVWLSVVPVSFF